MVFTRFRIDLNFDLIVHSCMQYFADKRGMLMS